MIKIIVIAIMLLEAVVAVFLLARDYKNIFNTAEIKDAIAKKDMSKIKAILTTLWKTVKSVKFLSLIADILVFILVLFV